MRTPVNRRGSAWIELLLVIALVSLLLQLCPALVQALDFRSWSRGTWLFVNLVFVLGLAGFRFAPEVLRARSDRHKRDTDVAAKLERKQRAIARRESIQRIKESRRRRLY
jgi:hypothetical protein